MDITGVMIWLVAQWWFYPVAVFYLFFGAWFGLLNYWVAKETDKYPYWLRFVLYPISTILREGWMNNTVTGSFFTSICRGRYVNLAAVTEVFHNDNPEAVCVVVFSFFWLLKVLLNLFVSAAIFALSILVVVYAIILVVVCLVLNTIVDIVLSGVSAMFRIVSPATKVKKNAS
ncbi:MAG TPA: hypothetical protein DEP08_00795 [Candidatus Jacksonbacteria bacterium]|nr:MAG: hypothetical protein UX07_C0024G0004 [Parcubacteria group bacterium GW2011_GWA2_45_30]HCE86327.1 hypothetical protein [Candidatus Jacksonbacteria bacterium]